MKNTIFQKLRDLYQLKKPSKKHLNKNHYGHLQNLAVKFYQTIFEHVFSLKIKHPLIEKYSTQSQKTVKQLYKQLFYALPYHSTFVLDFISCLICLLCDVIFIGDGIEEQPIVKQLFVSLKQTDMQLKQYFYIVYCDMTVGQRVSKQCAKCIFQKIILHENFQSSNFKSRMVLHYKIHKIQDHLKNNRHYIRKRTKQIRDGNSYQQEMKQIYQENREEIQQEKMQKQRAKNDKQNIGNNSVLAIYFQGKSDKNSRKSLNYWEHYVRDLKGRSFQGRISQDRSYTFLPLINQKKQSYLHRHSQCTNLNKTSEQTSQHQTTQLVPKPINRIHHSTTVLVSHHQSTNKNNNKTLTDSQNTPAYKQQKIQSRYQNLKVNVNIPIISPSKINRAIQNKQCSLQKKSQYKLKINRMRRQLATIVQQTDKCYRVAEESQFS